jgi:hypothetical protein
MSDEGEAMSDEGAAMSDERSEERMFNRHASAARGAARLLMAQP